jgi:hypothetical protein
MAQKEISFKITVDGKEIDLAKTSITTFEKAYTDAQKKLATLKLGSEEWKKLDEEVKKAGVAFLDAKDSMKATDDVNKSLRTRLRETRNELEALEEAGKTNSAEFRKLRQTYDELNDAQEVARFRSGQLDDQLAALPGPIGKVGQGFKGLNDNLKVLATNPFFLIITVVVGALALLKKSLDSTAEGQKTLAKFTDAVQKAMGPLLAILEAVAVPLFNLLADIILKVAEGFAFFAEKLGISTDKIKQAQSGIEDFAAAEKEAADKRKKAEEELAAKQKELAEEKKRRDEEYRQKRLAADKVLEDALLALMTESDRQKAQEEKLHQNNIKIIRAAGYKNFEAEERRHRKVLFDIQLEIDAKRIAQEEKFNEENRKIRQQGVQTSRDIYIKGQELFLEKLRLLNLSTVDNETKTLKKIRETQQEVLIEQQRARLVDFTNQRELQLKTKTSIYERLKFITETQKLESLIIQGYTLENENFQLETENKILDINLKNTEKLKQDKIKRYDDDLRLLELRSRALLQGTRAYFSLQEEIITKAYEKEKLLAEGNAETLLAIEAKYQKDKKALKDQELQSIGQVASQTINAIAAVTGALAQSYAAEANNTENTIKQREAAFEKNKEYQLATAYMSAASGVIQILTQPSTLPSPFDWIVKGINAAALLVATKVNTDTIKNTKFQGGGSTATSTSGTQYADGNFRGYATGGLINGPGSGTSDSIPARLSNGESVINANSTAMFLPLLSAMNAMGGGTAFNSNTMVASNDKPMTKEVNEPIIMRAYVVENDMTSIQQRQARLKELSVL